MHKDYWHCSLISCLVLPARQEWMTSTTLYSISSCNGKRSVIMFINILNRLRISKLSLLLQVLPICLQVLMASLGCFYETRNVRVGIPTTEWRFWIYNSNPTLSLWSLSWSYKPQLPLPVVLLLGRVCFANQRSTTSRSDCSMNWHLTHAGSHWSAGLCVICYALFAIWNPGVPASCSSHTSIHRKLCQEHMLTSVSGFIRFFAPKVDTECRQAYWEALDKERQQMRFSSGLNLRFAFVSKEKYVLYFLITWTYNSWVYHSALQVIIGAYVFIMLLGELWCKRLCRERQMLEGKCTWRIWASSMQTTAQCQSHHGV